MEMNNPLTLKDTSSKILQIEAACHMALTGKWDLFSIPQEIGRDIEVRAIKDLPKKGGVGSEKGQARLLHDLASIELQAMELGFRTLVEFNAEISTDFKYQLTEVILDESRHLKLCLDQMESLGSFWGEWPVHTGLWESVSEKDSLLDRILIVHRYLEGSGLDASDKLLRRLDQVGNKDTLQVVKTISEDEMGHVQFGSFWYKTLCSQMKIDSDEDFQKRSQHLFKRLPRRLEPIQENIRQQAGFSTNEIETLKWIQIKQSNK